MPAAPLIEFKGISKKFGGIYANRDISLAVGHGEIHALAGENGAGKTTLMNVLFGRVRPDSGSILLRGAPIVPRSPRDAIRAGIGMAHQKLLFCPQLSVLENIILGNEPSKAGILETGRARKEFFRLRETFGFNLDPDLSAGDVPYAGCQQMELLRMLYRGAGILILDEPTTFLAPHEVKKLLELLRSLRAGGRTILFISHRLDEVFAIADRITVLRHGSVAATLDAAATSSAGIARLMVGAGPVEEPRQPYPPSGTKEYEILSDSGRSNYVGQALRPTGTASSHAGALAQSLPAAQPSSPQVRKLPSASHPGGPCDQSQTPPEHDPDYPRPAREPHPLGHSHHGGTQGIQGESVESNHMGQAFQPDGTASSHAGALTQSLPAAQPSSPEVRKPPAAAPALHFPTALLPPLLEVREISVAPSAAEPGIDGLSFSVNQGEIFGIGGIVGNGHRQLARALAGRVAVRGGTIIFDGADITGLSLQERLKSGIRRVPEDPSRESLLPQSPLWENFLLGRQRQPNFQRAGIVRKNEAVQFATDQVRENTIAVRSPFAPVSSLSGGNQQKVALAMALSGSPRLAILEQPSRGLDLHAAGRMREKILALSARDTAIIILSHDLDELLALCDRIAILYRGRLTEAVMSKEASREILGKWMVGLK
ncbi:MAG: ATP-binding cassette domain-containing protein [Syntrophobacter sp.]